MDSTLPQMESFDFDRLDPVALEQTLAWFKEHPELPAWEAYEGVGPGMYTKMLEGDGVIDDWAMGGAMEDGLQDLAESRRYFFYISTLTRAKVSRCSLRNGRTCFLAGLLKWRNPCQ